MRDRRNETLFIDARKLGVLIDRTRKEFSDGDIARIANTYHAWRGEKDAGEYANEPGFCSVSTLDEIRRQAYILTPGRYVGSPDLEGDDVPFSLRIETLKAKLETQFAEAETLTAQIIANLRQMRH